MGSMELVSKSEFSDRKLIIKVLVMSGQQLNWKTVEIQVVTHKIPIYVELLFNYLTGLQYYKICMI